MKLRSRQILTALGLAIATGIAAPACMVRGSGTVGVSTTPVVYQEPPAPQIETVSARPGYVWVRGRWDWQNGQWAWVGGHWERERSGYAWQEGRWEQRGNAWHWVDGTWSVSTTHTDTYDTGGRPPGNLGNASGGVVVTDGGPGPGYNSGGTTTVVVTGGGPEGGRPPGNLGNASGGVVVTGGGGMYPTVAPPPPRAESYGAARSGYVWVTGRWNWQNGQWAWVDGHWERQRANQVWVPGRWELQGNYYVWVEGRWDRAAPPAPTVRDHRH